MAVDQLCGHDRDAACSERGQGRCPLAAFQRRALADDRAGSDLRDLLTVDDDGQHAVEQQVQLAPRLTLFDEHVAGLELPPLGYEVSPDELARELALEGALGRRDERIRLLGAPGRVVAVRLPIPLLEVDGARLLDKVPVVVVDPVPWERARADDLVEGRSVRSDRQREGGPGGRGLDAEERPAADPPRGREARPPSDRLDEAHGVRARFVGLEHVERDAWNGDLQAHAERRRPNEAATRVAVIDDLPVLDLDPGAQVVGLAKAISVAEALEVAFLQQVRWWLVVLADAELERELRHPLDRLRRNPRDSRHR